MPGPLAPRGPERLTFVATPSGDLYGSRAGNVGLAAAGSGDVLAGMIVGFLGRGATLVQAAGSGVHLHGCCGEVLARRVGLIGYLARELAGVLPAVMGAAVKPGR